jgi:hypothetical protein
MGVSSNVRLQAAVAIPNGQTVSNAVGWEETEDANLIMILAQESFGADNAFTFTFEVTESRRDAAAPVWRTLMDSSGVSIKAPKQDEARVYVELSPAMQWRIVSSGAVTAIRSWEAIKQDIK